MSARMAVLADRRAGFLRSSAQTERTSRQSHIFLRSLPSGALPFQFSSSLLQVQIVQQQQQQQQQSQPRRYFSAKKRKIAKLMKEEREKLHGTGKLPVRPCVGCGQVKEKTAFSQNQWWRTERLEGGRCYDCVKAKIEIPERTSHLTVSPENRIGVFDIEKDLFLTTRHRCLAKTKFVSGPRKGEMAVAKWFQTTLKTPNVEDSYARADVIGMREKAKQLVDEWNLYHGPNDLTITLTTPVSYRFPIRSDSPVSGRYFIYEPFLKGFQKYNSNTGWVNENKEDKWNKVLQAFSHFSHEASGCQNLVCDLQGAPNADGRGVTVTNPVVLSRKQDYGVADLGKEGMVSFFDTHCCNEYCSSVIISTQRWKFPGNNLDQWYKPQPHTLFRVKAADGSDGAEFIILPPQRSEYPQPVIPPQPDHYNDDDDEDGFKKKRDYPLTSDLLEGERRGAEDEIEINKNEQVEPEEEEEEEDPFGHHTETYIEEESDDEDIDEEEEDDDNQIGWSRSVYKGDKLDFGDYEDLEDDEDIDAALMAGVDEEARDKLYGYKLGDDEEEDFDDEYYGDDDLSESSHRDPYK